MQKAKDRGGNSRAAKKEKKFEDITQGKEVCKKTHDAKSEGSSDGWKKPESE